MHGTLQIALAQGAGASPPCPTCGLSPGVIDELRSVIASQAEEIRELKRQLEELKRRLSYYENSNSPPSSNSLLYREMKRRQKEERRRQQATGGGGGAAIGSVPTGKPGRKDGHEGVTRVFAPTGDPVVHAMERCPRCDSTRLVVKATEMRTLVDVPEPLPYTVREHVVNVYRCSGCGADGLVPESARKELPSSSVDAIAAGEHRVEKGNMSVTLGRNLISTISMLWSVARLPLRKVSYVLESMHGLRLSPATVWHSLQNMSERLEGFQEKVRRTVNRAGRANFDETGVSVAGKRGWIWVAATKTVALVLVAMSRGRDVLETYFPGFKGVATVDGWRSYSFFFRLVQRCWAHVLREGEVLALRARGKEEEAGALLSSLRAILHETKSELKEHPPPNPSLHYRMVRRLRALLRKEYRDPDVLKFVSKVMSASNDLFTFTLYPGVEPTNNHAERELKEPIVHRKIRGQLKCAEGMTVFSRLMTAVSTWKLQGLNPLAEFKRYS